MRGSKRELRIYLAGPEVFLPNARAVADEKKRLCSLHGFEGVFPLDVDLKLDGDLAPAEMARQISLSNEGLMRSCDLLVANCTPFRGASMDCGTAFEVGFMRALDRPVFGYSNVAADYKARSEHLRRLVPHNDMDGDVPGVEIEDFGLSENLMITVAMSESGAAMVTGATSPRPDLADLAAFERCLGVVRSAVAS